MEKDKSLEEFVQILRRIKDLIGEATLAEDQGIDLTAAVEQLRLSGNSEGADELGELCKRADELKALQQAKP